MYPRNAASPPRIAIGAVVQISDGAVQTSGCTVRILEQGGTEGDGAGTTAYSTDGIVLYTPTQAETDQAAFIVIAKKTGCIPVSQTIVTSASAVAGYAGLDWSLINAPTTTQNLSGTSTKAVEPTVAGRTLDISAGGEAGIDWANVGTPGSTVALSATTVATVTTVSGSVASVTGAVGSVTGAVGSVTGNVGGNVVGSVGSVTSAVTLPSIPANWITAAGIAANAIDADALAADAVTEIWAGSTAPAASAIADAVWDEARSGHTSAGTFGLYLDAQVSTVSGGSLTAADIADAVWDEAISGHLTAGSTGNALNAAGSAGDPWSTPLPGAYGSGTAGKILGDRLDATVGSRATQTSVDTIDGIVDDILLDTAVIGAAGAGLTSIPWNSAWDAEVQSEAADALAAYDPPTHAELTSGLAAADDAVLAVLGTPAGVSLAADVAAVKAQTAAIEADTQDVQTRLPAALVAGRIDASVGAMAAEVMTAAAAAADLTTELQSGLATAAALSTVAGYLDTEVAAILAAVDTEVAAIKAKTDNLPAAPAATGDIPSAGAIADAVLDEVVEGSVTLRQSVRLANAALGGKASGLDTTNPKYRDLADTKDRIDATVDANGNRSAVTRDLT